jgi:hypothetical protein
MKSKPVIFFLLSLFALIITLNAPNLYFHGAKGGSFNNTIFEIKLLQALMNFALCITGIIYSIKYLWKNKGKFYLNAISLIGCLIIGIFTGYTSLVYSFYFLSENFK